MKISRSTIFTLFVIIFFQNSIINAQSSLKTITCPKFVECTPKSNSDKLSLCNAEISNNQDFFYNWQKPDYPILIDDISPYSQKHPGIYKFLSANCKRYNLGFECLCKYKRQAPFPDYFTIGLRRQANLLPMVPTEWLNKKNHYICKKSPEMCLLIEDKSIIRIESVIERSDMPTYIDIELATQDSNKIELSKPDFLDSSILHKFTFYIEKNKLIDACKSKKQCKIYIRARKSKSSDWHIGSFTVDIENDYQIISLKQFNDHPEFTMRLNQPFSRTISINSSYSW
ncbi:TPA: hypothetical protein F7136_16630 [Legionella pneumophila]|uniref:Uncharacterized protein n=1 Tax=Legionella waltersii TaxID=66969 RepID=A0A0W1ANS3_9GAMM|nr:hypothetical protein [Legionella waltersii]HAU3628225.1 hypothetical protein [Legionella pneumophila]KTD82988.1 hypothetical protein Lwal_0104 [Legionella waltersii]SNV07495.1 Uncharacterised protein [Legionella waltersii]HAU3648725.1 hypothetical protein [Legionella pneumophila]HAU3655110.1 hypothetical protein [Legionella pneumophila]